ncbi:hypothetical protein QJQ45_024379, partial [Haematococcus lacustris]
VPQDVYEHCVAGDACNKPSSYAGVAKATRDLEQHTDTYLDRTGLEGAVQQLHDSGQLSLSGAFAAARATTEATGAGADAAVVSARLAGVDIWDTVHREESPSKSAWHVTCKRCPWTASINSVTRVAQHISGSKTDVKKCTAPDPEMVQLVRQHDASAASAASSTHKRRGEDGMEPSPSRQRASRNASQDVVTKEMIDDTHSIRITQTCMSVACLQALQRLDSQLAPMRAERSHFGCSVSFDGYTDESARSMLNATVTTPSGSMLESAIDTGNNKKTSVYLKETLKAVIMRVGVEDVVAVFSDNAANCVAAGKMLEEDEDLRVLSIPCGSHTLDLLLLEDIGGACARHGLSYLVTLVATRPYGSERQGHARSKQRHQGKA